MKMTKESKAMLEIRKIREKDDKKLRKMNAKELLAYMIKSADKTNKKLGNA